MECLIIAGDDVVENLHQGVGFRGVGEGCGDFSGAFAQASHGGVGVFDAAVVAGIALEGGYLILVKFLDGRQCVHGVVVGSRGVEEDVEQRQGDFALAQVVAGGFSDLVCLEIVEHVVAYLETESQEFGDFREFGRGVGVGVDGMASHLGAGHEQRRCLEIYDFEVGFLGEGVGAGVVNLVDFAERQQFAEPADGVDDADVAGGDGQLEGRRDEEVADQDGYVIVPHGVDCGLVAAELGFVDHVIMNQRCVVEELDGGCGVEHALRDGAEHARAQHHDDGTDLLALGGEVRVNHFVHQRVVGGKARTYQVVETREVGGDYSFDGL